MTTKSTVLFPPPELASCLSMAIVRDTRQADLCDTDRLSYFTASPLVAMTVVLQGQLHMSLELCDLAKVRTKEILPSLSVTPPQTKPTMSWSDGPVYAVTIGFYPEAWTLLGGDAATTKLPSELADIASLLLRPGDIAPSWTSFCEALAPRWAQSRLTSQFAQWSGSDKVADWTRQLLTRAALSGAGQSARSFERRIKRWTGQSRQALNAFAQLENLYSLRIRDPDAALAAIAADAQFSDQSHMGRLVKKGTGFPPAQLNQLIETNEAFWFYRLLGERL